MLKTRNDDGIVSAFGMLKTLPSHTLADSTAHEWVPDGNADEVIGTRNSDVARSNPSCPVEIKPRLCTEGLEGLPSNSFGRRCYDRALGRAGSTMP